MNFIGYTSGQALSVGCKYRQSQDLHTRFAKKCKIYPKYGLEKKEDYTVTNIIYKNLCRFAVIAFMTGCATNPTENLGDYPAIASTPEIAPATPKPIQPPAVYPDNTSSAPETFDPSSSEITGTYSNSLAVRNFIQQMVNKHGFSESYLEDLFSRAHRLDYVIKLESPAPSNQPSKPRLGSWTRYRNKFLTDDHINNGVQFWRNNSDAIERASQTYGVDPEYIVGIIGVETYFGKNIGKTHIFDALTTLSFDTHRRSRYFTEELENYLLMSREEGLNPLVPVGSWAGAMGLGQFMPSSFRRLAVDFNNDGRRDLWHQHDAIGSVAHYFSKSGWQFNQPVATENGYPGDASIIELSTYEGEEYWRVYHNFKVIKRYNNSNKYAMAVHQLAQAIKQRYNSQARL
jgi:membrane-bound lytic murein transglycosylase B